MEKYFSGKLMVRVTLNGCGLALDNARVYINNKSLPFLTLENGFTEQIPIFSSSKKGVKHNVDVRAECDGFISLLCKNVPISSGYLTVWNMPLAKNQNNEKARKQHNKLK